MKWIFGLPFLFASLLILPQASYGLGMKRLQANKRANVQVTMGMPDFYYSMDSYTVTFQNKGRGKTGLMTTTFTEPGFIYVITMDTCDGNDLGPDQACSITVQYNHPGSYPQNGLIEVTSPFTYFRYGVHSCNPAVC
jgi:hypothetical protein